MTSAFSGWGPPPPDPQPATEIDKYKTRICVSWLQQAGCQYGDLCLYAHGASELRPDLRDSYPLRAHQPDPSSRSSSSGGGNRFKSRLCPQWEASAFCPDGNTCYFAHGLSDLELPSRVHSVQVPETTQLQRALLWQAQPVSGSNSQGYVALHSSATFPAQTGFRSPIEASGDFAVSPAPVALSKAASPFVPDVHPAAAVPGGDVAPLTPRTACESLGADGSASSVSEISTKSFLPDEGTGSPSRSLVPAVTGPISTATSCGLPSRPALTSGSPADSGMQSPARSILSSASSSAVPFPEGALQDAYFALKRRAVPAFDAREGLHSATLRSDRHEQRVSPLHHSAPGNSGNGVPLSDMTSRAASCSESRMHPLLPFNVDRIADIALYSKPQFNPSQQHVGLQHEQHQQPGLEARLPASPPYALSPHDPLQLRRRLELQYHRQQREHLLMQQQLQQQQRSIAVSTRLGHVVHGVLGQPARYVTRPAPEYFQQQQQQQQQGYAHYAISAGSSTSLSLLPWGFVASPELQVPRGLGACERLSPFPVDRRSGPAQPPLNCFRSLDERRQSQSWDARALSSGLPPPHTLSLRQQLPFYHSAAGLASYPLGSHRLAIAASPLEEVGAHSSLSKSSPAFLSGDVIVPPAPSNSSLRSSSDTSLCSAEKPSASPALPPPPPVAAPSSSFFLPGLADVQSYYSAGYASGVGAQPTWGGGDSASFLHSNVHASCKCARQLPAPLVLAVPPPSPLAAVVNRSNCKGASMFQPLGAVAEHVEHSTDAATPATTQLAAGDMMALKSLCMGCGEDGVTNLLLITIPFFKNVIVMAFECEHCGLRNSEVQPAEVQEKGCTFELRVESKRDLNRQIVKSDRASVRIPELDFEIPSGTQRGVFTTLEGLLDRALENLGASQALRHAEDPASAAAVDEFLGRLRRVKDGEALPFTLIMDDPSGNSFLENPVAPRHDPQLRAHLYTRTLEQDHAMGMYAESAGAGMTEEGAAAVAASAAGGPVPAAEAADDTKLVGSAARTTLFPPQVVDLSGNVPSGFRKGGALIRNPTERATATERGRAAAGLPQGPVRATDGTLEALVFDSSSSDAAKEVMRFPVHCWTCGAPGECRMCVTDVPHFKEVIIMAFTCDACGRRSVEVKGGGAIPDKGSVTELHYDPALPEANRDLTRDCIKSDTAAVEIPELDLVVQHGSLGGLYTTVEGLLTAIRDKIADPFNAESTDSQDPVRKTELQLFAARMDDLIAGKQPFTLRISDPMANSWIYSPTAPEPDPRLRHTQYERTHDENLELGLLDMKTEGYGEEPEGEAAAAAAAAGAVAKSQAAEPLQLLTASAAAPDAAAAAASAGAGGPSSVG